MSQTWLKVLKNPYLKIIIENIHNHEVSYIDRSFELISSSFSSRSWKSESNSFYNTQAFYNKAFIFDLK